MMSFVRYKSDLQLHTSAMAPNQVLTVNVRCCRVTEENKREYVNLVARHRMTTAIKPQINSFLEGFWDLVPKVSS